MSKLIKNGQVISDEWKVLRLAEGDSPQDVRLPVGPVIVPLSVWKARRRELVNREYEHGWALGIWLSADENPQAIENDIDDFSVVAIEFDKFSDGKSYLIPRLLRERYGYRSELRAIGDVPQERVAYLHQIGFDAIELRIGKQVGAAFFRLFDFNQIATEAKLLAA
jgi:uncharacterized protein (DUF934 family)